MKQLITLLVCFASLTSHGQETTTPFDGHKWEAPYHLSLPKDWGLERFLVPMSFAPQILYKGVEDIRFTPGWAKTKSDEYWTYAFLWYLDGSVKTNKKIIERNLKAYYTGLFTVNSDSAKVAAWKLKPVITAFKKVPADKGDVTTFTGTIEMIDYMQQKSITLNCKAHLKYCKDEDKTILFYELSPQPFTHTVWSGLGKLWSDFRCKK